MARTNPRSWPVMRFVLRLASGWLAALVLLSLVPAIERGVVQATLRCLIVSARLLGQPAQVQGDVIQVGDAAPMQIVPDCTSLLPTVALWAAILAFPASLPRKFLGMLSGAGALWLFNLVRVLTLIAILGWPQALVSLLHIFVWQTATILLVGGLFMLWLRQGAGTKVA